MNLQIWNGQRQGANRQQSVIFVSNTFLRQLNYPMKTKQVIAHIVSWLKNYIENSNSKGFVVGVSGGIDSAVTSTLCAHTGLPTLCLEMAIHQEKKQTQYAKNHLVWLQKNHKNVTVNQLDLSAAFDSLVSAFPPVKVEESRFMALANARARLRMTSLYYFAALNNHLVAGTGNKIEDFGIGFFTKYGDGGVDLSPIADLNKTEVYTLAKELGIIKAIIKAPPTDGLWADNRTDEDQIGASYPELEWAMEMTRQGKTPKDFTNRKKEVISIYKRLNRANKHKMIPIPVCEIPDKYR